MTPALGIDSLSGLAGSVGAGTKKDDLGQEDFLRLMVSQLQNQNPLKPLENTEFLGQLAQFSVVSGIQNLQSSFGQLAESLQANQALQGSSLLGHSALVPAAQVWLEGDAPAVMAIDLPQSTSAAAIEVRDRSGQIVRTFSLGSLEEGLRHFEWDGLDSSGNRMAPGLYTVQAQAEQNNQAMAIETLVAADIQSVSLGGASGLVLNLAGLGAVSLSQVRQIQ